MNKITLIIICFFWFYLIYALGETQFKKFISNEVVQKLLDDYNRRIIKTRADLIKHLKDENIFVSERTLGRYLSKVKVNLIKKYSLFFSYSPLFFV
jgi:arginine repressor